MIKNYLRSYLYLFSSILTLTLLLTLINYFFNFPVTIIKVLIPVISILISSIILGRNTKSKAYLEGIKFTLIYILFSIILLFIFKTPFSFKIIITYIIFLLSGIIGSMIGINLNKEK